MTRIAQCDALQHEYNGPAKVPGNQLLTLAGSIFVKCPRKSNRPRADAAPPAATAEAGQERTPLCFIIDEESSIRHFVSLILQGVGIDTMEFADGEAFRAARSPRAPDLIFLNISLDASDAIQSIEALGKLGYAGAVQLMSNRGSAVLENLRHIGEQHKLRMLPVLKKPFETSAIQKHRLRAKARLLSQDRGAHQSGRRARERLGRVLVPAQGATDRYVDQPAGTGRRGVVAIQWQCCRSHGRA